ncbi:MAG TPA: hypothetical protein VE988_17570 [Gemmataceae bacterium]|nr:hypothetical protein [Gemmataceae bacterium]
MARRAIFPVLMLPLIALGCQLLPESAPKEAFESEQSAEGSVSVGSITQDGALEKKFNRIQRGMDRKTVVKIMGREPDQGVLPGGSCGGESCYWFEGRVTVFVSIDYAPDFETYAVNYKSIIPTTEKRGPPVLRMVGK